MDCSFQGKSSLDEIIFSRIRAIVGILADAKEQIKKENIKGDIDNSLKRLLCKIIEIVETSIEDILEEIAEIGREDIKIHRSERVHRVLDRFLHLVETIRIVTPQVPTELYYLTRGALRQLRHEDIKVVLIPEASLGTVNLSEGLQNFFVFFEDILSYIKSDFPFYWIIYVPASFIRAPLNWPLIGHEIGHILERQKWKLVDGYYPYPAVSTAITELYRPTDLKSCYAQEFQADFVAFSYFGPIFARRLLAIYYTKELVISPTHPSWSERFGAMAQKLEETECPSEAANLRQISEREIAVIGRDRIEYLGNIYSETATMLNQSGCVYTRDDTMEEKAKSRLARFAPYTDDMRVLLNVAQEALENILSSTPNATKRRDLESDFDDLVKDSIRLNYIKQISAPGFNLGLSDSF